MIDSATEACSIALFDEAEFIAGDWQMLGRGHAEQLVPMIAQLTERGRAARIVVDIGPGSFTGIRVGLAVAKALALAWRAELKGYGAPALVGAIARETAGGEPIDVAMTGGHGQWFVQRFRDDGASLDDVASLTPQQAAERSTARVVAGSQAEALATLRRGSVRAMPLWPDARAYRLLRGEALVADPRPAYGRAPDARLPVAAAK